MKFLRDVPLLWPPEEEVVGTTSPVTAGLQDVVTRQCAQEKLMVPAMTPVAEPEKTPEELIDTPSKSIQPVRSPQAKPERFPCPSFSTPPFAGERFIQPDMALQAYPVIPESVT